MRAIAPAYKASQVLRFVARAASPSVFAYNMNGTHGLF